MVREMKIEQHGNKYRVRKTYKGKTYSLTFDHKPTQKEIMLGFADLMENQETYGKGQTFGKSLSEYLSIKENVLSPSTIKNYRILSRQFSDHLMAANIYDLDAPFIQAEVNNYSANHSPKSTSNFYGLISAVIGTFRPKANISITLPQKAVYEPKIPTTEDIQKVLKELEGTEYHIVVQLCLLGLRRSEACACTLSDLNGNLLTINKAMVVNPNGGYSVRNNTKNMTSTREIYLPDKLVEEIKQKGYIYNGFPNSINRALHKAQDRAGVPRCRIHDMRHYYVSFAHSLGMSDANIMASGGWKTDSVMKRVYRHDMRKTEEQKRIADNLL